MQKNFISKRVWKNALALKSKKMQSIFGETLILSGKHCRLQLSFIYKIMSLISFSLFCLGDKRLSQILWGNEVGFKDMMYFPKGSGSILKIKKTETQFLMWKRNDYNDINIFLSLENCCTFCFRKTRPKSSFLKLTV